MASYYEKQERPRGGRKFRAVREQQRALVCCFVGLFTIILVGCGRSSLDSHGRFEEAVALEGVERVSRVAPTPSSEPVLTVEWPGTSRRYTASDLLRHPQVETVKLQDEGAYRGRALLVRAVPIAAVFAGVEVGAGQTVEFDTLDGFSASLDPALLFGGKPGAAEALLAVEDPAEPWPPLEGKRSSAGPFYLIWKNSEGSAAVGQEQWPYQLRSFRVASGIQERFPGLLPDPSLSEDHPVRAGYRAFLKNCFACHTLNGEGNSRMGPDLNLPYSPTEYLKEEFLRKLIRDPQTLRHWPEAKMSAFPEEALPEPELEALLLYLEHKAEQRQREGGR